MMMQRCARCGGSVVRFGEEVGCISCGKTVVDLPDDKYLRSMSTEQAHTLYTRPGTFAQKYQEIDLDA